MFDIGFWELLVIGLVALVVIGPERLPGVARTVGHYVGKMQRFVAGVKSDIQQELDASELRELLQEQDKQLKSLREMVQDTRQEVQQSVSKAESDLQEAAGKYHGIGKPLDDDSPAPAPAADSANQPSSAGSDAPETTDATQKRA
jgi:sec-independent protein translocase protein TatB